MPRDFYPRREADIRQWTSNFRETLEADPPLYGISPAQAAEYAIVQERFVDLYQAANSPTQRTPSVLQAKETARIALEAATRALAAQIRAHPTMTTDMRIALGLAVRGRGGYHRAFPAPEQSPRLTVRAMNGRIATIVLSDREGTRRRKPREAHGAIVWSHVGELPPASLDRWTYAGQTTRTINRVAFANNLPPGATVWLAACWMTSRGKQSEPCAPVCTHVAGGGLIMPETIKSANMLYVSGFEKTKAKPDLKLAA